MSSYLGIDIGTSGCKAVVFDERGRPLASASRGYRLHLTPDGGAELDSDEVMDSCLAVIAGRERLLDQYGSLVGPWQFVLALALLAVALEMGRRAIKPILPAVALAARQFGEFQPVRRRFDAAGEPAVDDKAEALFAAL
jgi:hypothetical protein